VRDRRHVVGGQDQLPRGVAQEHDVQHLGVAQKLVFQIVVDHPVRGQKRQRGDLRPFEARQQVILAEAGDGGDENEHLGQHHEDDRQDQEAS
jgi:hypothetical protein